MMVQNQWLKLSFVLLIALLARVALGDKQAARSVSSQASTSQAVAPSRSSLPFEFTIGPGAIAWSSVLGGATGYVTNIGTTLGVGRTSPVSVGLDLGVGFLSVNPTTNAVYLRLAPTVVYKVSLPQTPSVTPYFGLTVGPNVTIFSIDNPAGGSSGSDTKAYFEGLTRVGVQFSLARNLGLAVESKVGILGGEVEFIPTALFSVVL